jgi:alkanesulfonate monooxygenase SsuD/methylene tetrahydromethanopterin reductase-like flavin-dependent oxidoreductase (luciferase family)
MDPGQTVPRVDVVLTLNNVGGHKTWAELLEYARRRAQMLDGLGFDGVWIGEHHFDTDSTDACPNPVLLAADLAARTERLRMCMGAVTLTTWHPLRLAEDLAMLDHFCNGRLDIGLSRGILPIEIINLNPDADRSNPTRSQGIFAENLEILRRAWGEEKFSWQGQHYTIPVPGIRYQQHPGVSIREGYADENGNLIKLSVVPRPLQTPMPRLWAVTNFPAGFVSAAKAGLGGIAWYPSGKRLLNMLEAHRTETAKLTRVTPPLGTNCAILRETFIAPTDAEARTLFEPGLNNLYAFIATVRGKAVWFDEGEDPNDSKFANSKAFDLLMERDHLLVGSPESVTERMLHLEKTHGIQHWLLEGMDGGSTSEAHRLRSLELMAKEVMPALGRSLPPAA